MINTCNNELLTLFFNKGGGGGYVYIVSLPLLEVGKLLFIRYELPTSFVGRESIVFIKYELHTSFGSRKVLFIRYELPTSFGGRESIYY